LAETRRPRPIRITPAARDDIRASLAHSEVNFGRAARKRYRTLIDRALEHLSRDPEPPASRAVWEVQGDLRVYHIRFAQQGGTAHRIGRPRHAVIYELRTDSLLVVRLLHERQLVPRTLTRSGDTPGGGP
jgi:toxin ParE1/3/4